MTNYNKNSPDTIRQLFNSIAQQYDRTNAVMSFNMHKRWNNALIQQAILPSQPHILLDLCCGTGAIAFEYLRQIPSSRHAYMLDFSEGMLAHARSIADNLHLERHRIDYLQADARSIPLADNSVDCTTIAYGIRNVSEPHRCLAEVHRVLRPGGRFGILELTQPQNPLLHIGHRLYLRTILPLIGKMLTSNQEAYKYLCNSINTFIPAGKLAELMHQAGFKDIHMQAMSAGIATLLIAKK